MDLRSPYVVSIVDLPRQDGAHIDFSYEFAAPVNCGVELLAVQAGAPMYAELNLQSVTDGILVNGTVEAIATGHCSRCLREIKLQMREKVVEMYFYPEVRQGLLAEGDAEAEDFSIVEDDQINLEPALRDSIVLAMPFIPLCEPDCEGLCADCGEAWRDLPQDHHHEQLDSRFAALDALREKFVAGDA